MKHEITREAFVKWGRIGGRKSKGVSSPAKRRSSKANGRTSGGSPKKMALIEIKESGCWE